MPYLSHEDGYESEKAKRLKGLAIIVLCIVAISMIATIITTQKKSKSPVTTEVKEQPCKPKVVHDTIYKCPPTNERPIPAITKFKISDWVCAWDKITGVVLRITWSEESPNLLQYEVVYSIGEDANGAPKWENEIFYESTLTAGKCR